MDFSRVKKALAQEVRGMERAPAMSVDEVIPFLERIVAMSECETYSRARLVRIGSHIMRNGLRVLAPACPDYAHEEGVYTFTGVGSETSLLAQLQMQFLQDLQIENVTLVYADVECFDDAICRKLGIDSERFLGLVRASCAHSRERVPSTWRAVFMSDLIPDFRENSECRMGAMLESTILRERLVRETHQRIGMYQKIVPRSTTFDELLLRTARTAAQYCEVGEFALHNGFVISNHVTTNLAWYDEVCAVVLSNPVRIY